MKRARIPLLGYFLGVAEGDLAVGEPGVFGFVADEGYDGGVGGEVFF